MLHKFQRTKRLFNVNSKEDVSLFKNYFVNNSWGANGCPFEIEFPHTSVPDMIKDKLLRKYLKV